MKRATGNAGTRPNLVFADEHGTVLEYPGMEPAFRSGRCLVRAGRSELISLPYGSYLFTLPGRNPVRYSPATREFAAVKKKGASAVSAFLASGYLRTLLPAFESRKGAPLLPLWAYAGVAVRGDGFAVPALRVDDDPRSDPAIHENDEELAAARDEVTARFPANALVRQLAMCAVEYRCLCARNFFLSRHEMPVPTTRACNARCVGCLSHQPPESGIPASQDRLRVEPSPEEIAEAVVHHFERVDDAVASFGQGCEGEPLLRGNDLARAVALIRDRTARGTININTNGSCPDKVRLLIRAGLDSIRVSMNSPVRSHYERYYSPAGYSYDDVLATISMALDAGIYVSLNVFFLPGFTDSEPETGALLSFLERFPVNMIQTRNLNMDPDAYLDAMEFGDPPAMGVRKLCALLSERMPKMKIGYYNPPKERFAGG